MEILRARGLPRKVGAIGLGVGAAAAYLEPGESIDFFEIDPTVVDLARTYFTYLSDCRGRARTIVGDARMTLARLAEEASPPRFDLLLVDAFAGDAIPTHLLTREAVRLYRRMLGDRGVLLFHVSNRYYDLRPVLATIARDVGVVAGMRDLRDPPDPVAADPSQYVVMLAREEDFTPFAERGFRRVTATDPPPTVLWTDDHANTLAALRLDW
jgi:spermidine synthase